MTKHEYQLTPGNTGEPAPIIGLTHDYLWVGGAKDGPCYGTIVNARTLRCLRDRLTMILRQRRRQLDGKA
jgi:hypothetical protein